MAAYESDERCAAAPTAKTVSMLVGKPERLGPPALCLIIPFRRCIDDATEQRLAASLSDVEFVDDRLAIARLRARPLAVTFKHFLKVLQEVMSPVPRSEAFFFHLP